MHNNNNAKMQHKVYLPFPRHPENMLDARPWRCTLHHHRLECVKARKCTNATVGKWISFLICDFIYFVLVKLRVQEWAARECD
jgi:hypothetical protein